MMNAVIVAFFIILLPICYQVNDRVTPWAGGRVNENGDRYLIFWASNTVLHWVSAVAVVVVSLWAGVELSTIGLSRPRHSVTWLLIAISAVSLVFYYLNVIARPEVDNSRARRYGDIWTPVTDRERLLGVFTLGVTPGLCEEIVYRGFMIGLLLSLGVSSWTAIGIATVPFILLHGQGATSSTGTVLNYASLGVVFGYLFIEFETIWPAVALHTAYNFLGTVRSSRQYFSQAEYTS